MIPPGYTHTNAGKGSNATRSDRNWTWFMQVQVWEQKSNSLINIILAFYYSYNNYICGIFHRH